MGTADEAWRVVSDRVDAATHVAKPSGQILWKGTDICIDIECECGARLHADETCLYAFRCGECGAVFAVGAYVKLVRLEPEEVATLKATRPYGEEEGEVLVTLEDSLLALGREEQEKVEQTEMVNAHGTSFKSSMLIAPKRLP